MTVERYCTDLLGSVPTCRCGGRLRFRGLKLGFAERCSRTCPWVRNAAESLGLTEHFEEMQTRDGRISASRKGSFTTDRLGEAFLRSLPQYGIPVKPVVDRVPVVIYPDARGRLRTWRARFWVRDRDMVVDPVLLSRMDQGIIRRKGQGAARRGLRLLIPVFRGLNDLRPVMTLLFQAPAPEVMIRPCDLGSYVVPNARWHAPRRRPEHELEARRIPWPKNLSPT